MQFRLVLLLTTAIFCVGCGAFETEISTEVAVQVGTEVAEQVGTVVVDQVATVMAEKQPAVAIDPSSTPSKPQTEVEGQTIYDCSPKYCKDMTSCEEAVYKLTVCGFGRLDANNDGVPCESICTASAFAAVSIIPPTRAPVAEPAPDSDGELALVTRVIDGDTIDVRLDGKTERIRYLQINTPERSAPCYRESTEMNADLVAGQTVRLVPDKELIDPYNRLLRYVYVGEVLVNRVLVEGGWAEVVLYPPNDMRYDEFVRLEAEAAAAGRGCHPTGIFDDGSTTR
ncbi:MAG: hypothetical protein F4X87_11535 [Chloroflexi bacterium]|nr:hypothetical protein [Chloroflexota bacterium]